MLFKVLIISNSLDHRRITKSLDGKSINDNFQLRVVGMTENSVVGMKMIEQLQPDMVIMPLYMNFWNAEDLILRLTLKEYSIHFIIIYDHAAGLPTNLSENRMVSAVIDHKDFNETVLTQALISTAKEIKVPPSASSIPSKVISENVFNWICLQADLTRILKNRTEWPDTSALHEAFPQFLLDPVWIMLASAANLPETDGNICAFASDPIALFVRLSPLFDTYGGGTLCLSEDNLFFIFLSTAVIRSTRQMNGFLKKTNEILRISGFPVIVLDVTSQPCALTQWPDICDRYEDLVTLHRYRFFLNDTPILTADRIHPVQVQPEVLLERCTQKIEHLTRSIYISSREQIQTVLGEIFDIIGDSCSDDLFEMVWNQLMFRYMSLIQMHGLTGQQLSGFHPLRRHVSISQYQEEAVSAFSELFDVIKKISKKQNLLVSQGMAIIQEEYARELSLSSAAQKLHVNPSYLSRLFTREMGKSFMNCLNQYRIDRAKDLLRTNQKINDIAEAVGFNDTKYFNQVFKKYTGMSAQEFRNTLGKQEVK